MIDCHVVFNEPTDREDWLERCLKSLEHPDVTIHVHRFKASAPVKDRQIEIHNSNDPSRWCMFADPDDYAVEPGYSAFIDHLKTFSGDVTHSMEVWLPEGRESSRVHHLVAVRNRVAEPDQSYVFNFFWEHESVLFPQVAYAWVHHDANTRGGRFKPDLRSPG